MLESGAAGLRAIARLNDALSPFECGVDVTCGVVPFIGRGRVPAAAPTTTRPLTAADLGVDAGRISLLRNAYFSVRGDVATVNIDGIRAAGGLGRQAEDIMDSLISLARSSGASTLRIESEWFANRALRRFLSRYGTITEIPGPFRSREVVTIAIP